LTETWACLSYQFHHCLFGAGGCILVDLIGMRMASIASSISLAHVGDYGFRVHRLDLQGRNERVFGFDRDLIRLVPDPDPDCIA
jgi:hypothetical protein